MITTISSLPTNKPAPCIVFVHGLGGNSNDTWHYAPNKNREGFKWPEALAKSLLHCHVHCVNYHSNIFASTSKGSGANITDIASSLTEELLNKTPHRYPLIFICHSLGGIVVKQLLYSCAHSEDHRHKALVERVSGLIFLGTPHQGASLAKFISNLTSIGASKATQLLAHGNDYLSILHTWFIKYCKDNKKLKIKNFYESYPTQGIKLAPAIMIVPKEHTDLSACGIQSVGLMKDHIQISKPENQSDLVYLSTLELITELVGNFQFPSTQTDSLQSLDIEMEPRFEKALEHCFSGLTGFREGSLLQTADIKLDGNLLRHYLSVLPNSKDINFLPPLLGNSKGLPIATMYVELTISENQLHTMPDQLERRLTLAQAMQERHKSRKAKRLSVKEAIDENQHRHVVILGDPGGGKSSLLKRICLDVSQGKWQKWFVPFIIPLRLYWTNRKQYNNDSFSLLHYICLRLYAARSQAEFRSEQSIVYSQVNPQVLSDIKEFETFISLFSGTKKEHIVFLLDGFDEIAADQEARECITQEINELSYAFSWIVTSRRAGFSGGLNEDICYEIVELDDDNIELLAENWFKHQPPDQNNNASGLLQQVFDNDRLLMMARNPFLLTLLCYLQAQRPGELPLNRYEIYQEIFNSAVQIDQNKRGNSAITHEHVEHLSEFCHSTYTQMIRPPHHLFTEKDWNEFSSQFSRPNLVSELCPTRLIDQWSDRSIYHLVHLTLHEFLVATAMMRRDPKLAIKKLYHPAWRVVLRFIASMWWHGNQRENFRALLERALNPLDQNGMNLIEAAQFLVEAGITDSSSILGFDLRDLLWEKWLSDQPYISDAAADALVILSPRYTIQKCILLIQNKSSPSDKEDLSRAIARHYGNQSSTRNPKLRAISLLGKVRHEQAQEYLISIIEDSHLQPAFRTHASKALALQNVRTVRKAIVAKLEKLSADEDTFEYYCIVAKEMAHEDFIDVLALQLMTRDSNSAQCILNALKQIATKSATSHLIHWYNSICSNEGKENIDEQTQQDVFEAIVAGKSNIAQLFFLQMRNSEDEFDQIRANYYLIKGHFLSTGQLIELLKTDDLIALEGIIELLGDEADSGWEPSKILLENIRTVIDTFPQNYILCDGYAKMVIRYFHRNEQNLSGKFFREILKLPVDKDAYDLRPIAIYLCGQTRDVLSTPDLIKLARSELVFLKRPAIEALAHMEASPEIFELLHQCLETESNAEDVAADTLAQLDMEQAIQRREHPAIKSALSRLAAEKGLLLFDDFYVDKMGITTGYLFKHTS